MLRKLGFGFMETSNKFINLGITVFNFFIFCGISSVLQLQLMLYGSASFTQILNLGAKNQQHISLNVEYSNLRNKFDLWSVHEIMNTSDILQSK